MLPAPCTHWQCLVEDWLEMCSSSSSIYLSFSFFSCHKTRYVWCAQILSGWICFLCLLNMTAFFQTDQPIYSAQYVRIRLGYSIMPSKSRSVVNKASQCIPAEEYLWMYESPKFSMEQVYPEVVHMQFAILPFLIFAWGESYKVTVKGYLDSSNFQSLSGSFSPGHGFLYCKYRDFSILMEVMFNFWSGHAFSLLWCGGSELLPKLTKMWFCVHLCLVSCSEMLWN